MISSCRAIACRQNMSSSNACEHSGGWVMGISGLELVVDLDRISDLSRISTWPATELIQPLRR